MATVDIFLFGVAALLLFLLKLLEVTLQFLYSIFNALYVKLKLVFDQDVIANIRFKPLDDLFINTWARWAVVEGGGLFVRMACPSC